jgi:hypothetical protein
MYLSSVEIVKKTIHYLLENDELNENLIFISLSKNDIKEQIVKFERIDEKEFRLNDKMYDIRKDLSDKDSLRFLCYLDEYENFLEKLFSKFSDSENNNKSNYQINFSFIPFLALYFQQTDLRLNTVAEIILKVNHSDNLLTINGDVLTPPPKC